MTLVDSADWAIAAFDQRILASPLTLSIQLKFAVDVRDLIIKRSGENPTVSIFCALPVPEKFTAL